MLAKDYKIGDEVSWGREGYFFFGCIDAISTDRKMVIVKVHQSGLPIPIAIGELMRVERNGPPPARRQPLTVAADDVHHLRWLLNTVDKLPLSTGERVAWNHVDAIVLEWEKCNERA